MKLNRMLMEAPPRELRQTLIENPHGIQCPHGPHIIADMFVELLATTADRIAVVKGQAAMICPICGNSIYWPTTLLHNPAIAPSDMPITYWSREIWKQRSPTQRQDDIGRVKALRRYLK